MDIKSLILNKIKQKKVIKASDIVKATGFSRAYINRFFQELREEGRIVLIGQANKARYVLAQKGAVAKAKKGILVFRCLLKNKSISEDVVLDEIKKKTGIFLALPKNVIQILNYDFTEMLNNAIEHSRSQFIKIFMEKGEGTIRFDVIDKGVGIFNNIMKKRGLNNHLEAIQDLIKGKQTTAPKEHTGEGIFFASKAADRLTIQSSKKKLIFDNIAEDIFIKDIKKVKGTKVNFIIRQRTKRDLNAIFRQYTEGMFEFGRTRVIVKLYKTSTEYISRSQARRIVSGLEKFRVITLDFEGVKTIGQGFADEIFRVWQRRHPGIKIICKNANENILFMVERAISGSD